MRADRVGVFAACAGLAAGVACGQAHEAVLISDPASADALRVANHYAEARGLPASSFAWFAPAGNNIQQTVESRHAALFGHLVNKRIERSIDYVVLGPLSRYRMNASGLVSDQCSPVNRFSIPGSYTFAPFAQAVLAGGYASTQRQGFFTTANAPIAFDANQTYTNGSPGGSSTEGNLFIAASLGYTGERGVSADTIVAMIDRSVAADGQTAPGLFPTFIFVETDDAARSSPRDGAFTQAVARIAAAGLPAAELSPGPLPPSGIQTLGVMTGAANLDFASTDFTLENGAFADHLTSWAADFDRSQQTKCSAWIERGAVGTFGTIEEPCAYSEKFPSAYLHSNYAQGVTLGEALLRSLAAVPFQGYFMGDPLCRPYATGPAVAVTGVPTGGVQGTFTVTVNATPTRAGTGLGQAQVLVDGVVVAEGSAGGSFVIPTAHLEEGWHELRAVVVDDSPQRVIGEWVGSFTLANTGKTLTMTPGVVSGSRDTEFTFPASWTGGFIDEIRIVHLGRVVAAGNGTTLLRVRGEQLGAGPARVWAEVDFQDGTTARSAPVVLDIADTFSGGGATPPQAVSYTKRVAPGEVFVVETPAVVSTAVGAATFGATSGPAQADLLAADGPTRIYRADPTATGSDTLNFTVTDANGSSSGTVTIEYRAVPVPCLADINGDGVASPSDFNAFILAYNAGDPASDQNGDGVFGAGVTGSASDFNAWILNYNTGCQF